MEKNYNIYKKIKPFIKFKSAKLFYMWLGLNAHFSSLGFLKALTHFDFYPHKHLYSETFTYTFSGNSLPVAGCTTRLRKEA